MYSQILWNTTFLFNFIIFIDFLIITINTPLIINHLSILKSYLLPHI